MPSRPLRFVAFVLVVAAFGALIACSGNSNSSSTSSGDKAAFCKTNADLDAAAEDVQTPDQLVTAFKENSAKLDDLVKQAPPEVKADTDELVAAARKAAASGNASDFASDQSLQTAGQHLTSFCGSSSGSTTSSSSST